ncbi:MAG: hypothetical protein L0154_07375 [Chloroflexi bacterium]|nr:hypothetical protein [Chloroflexota bacterium]
MAGSLPNKIFNAPKLQRSLNAGCVGASTHDTSGGTTGGESPAAVLTVTALLCAAGSYKPVGPHNATIVGLTGI